MPYGPRALEDAGRCPLGPTKSHQVIFAEVLTFDTTQNGELEMGSKQQSIIGWILSGLIAILLIGPSAMSKFLEWEGKDKMFAHIGFSSELIFKIGILEVMLAVIYLIPRTSFFGAILLTGYLGGATVTHLRVGDPFIAPVIIGVVMWIGLGLRSPAIFTLAMGGSSAPKNV